MHGAYGSVLMGSIAKLRCMMHCAAHFPTLDVSSFVWPLCFHLPCCLPPHDHRSRLNCFPFSGLRCLPVQSQPPRPCARNWPNDLAWQMIWLGIGEIPGLVDPGKWQWHKIRCMIWDLHLHVIDSLLIDFIQCRPAVVFTWTGLLHDI